VFGAADLHLSEDEMMIREQFAALVAGVWDPSSARRVREHPEVEMALWAHLGNWAGLAATPLVQLCQALQIGGARLLPGSFAATVGLLAPVLQLVDPASFERLCAGRLRGTATFLLASWAGAPTPDDRSLALSVEGAEMMAIVERHQVRLVRSQSVRDIETDDLTRTFGLVEGAEIELARNEALIEPHQLERAVADRLLARGAVVIAADMVGSARRLCDDAVVYVGSRQQFGRPIGSFQAVQHRIVDMTMLAERAAAAVDYAAVSIDAQSKEALPLAHVAKAVAGEAVTRCAREAVQLQGAVGFTWENDTHLHLRRGYLSDALMGSTSWHRWRTAALLTDGAGALPTDGVQAAGQARGPKVL
jgi:alkylation response protein AidB-like acyl-CoA dehydrogenase